MLTIRSSGLAMNINPLLKIIHAHRVIYAWPLNYPLLVRSIKLQISKVGTIKLPAWVINIQNGRLPCCYKS